MDDSCALRLILQRARVQPHGIAQSQLCEHTHTIAQCGHDACALGAEVHEAAAQLCEPAETVSKGIVNKSAIMEHTLRCILVQLQMYNQQHKLVQAVAACFARTAGWLLQMGLAQPRAEE